MLAVIYVYAPLSLEDVAKLRWLDDTSIRHRQQVPRTRKGGSRGFRYRPNRRSECRRGPGLSNCPTDEIDRRMALVPDRSSRRLPRAICTRRTRQTGSRGKVSRAGNRPSLEWGLVELRKYRARSPLQAGFGSRQKSPHLHSDEICKRDEERLQRLSNSPTSEKAMRFLTELRCGKLRPGLFRLTERLDYQDPDAAVAAQSHPSNVAEAGVAGRRATEPQNRTRVRFAQPFSRDDVRTGGWPRAYRRFFWRFSARRRGTRPHSVEPEPMPDRAAAGAAGECQRLCWRSGQSKRWRWWITLRRIE